MTPFRGTIPSHLVRTLTRDQLRRLRRLGYLPRLAGGDQALADPKKALAALNDEVTAKRRAYRSVQAEVKTARESITAKINESGAQYVSSQEGLDALAAVEKLHAQSDSAADELQKLVDAQHQLRRSVVEDTDPAATDDPSRKSSARDRRSFGQRITDHAAFKQLVEEGVADSEAKFGTRHFGKLADRDEVMAIITSGGSDSASALTQPERRPSVEMPIRELSLIDLITRSTTDNNAIEIPVLRTRTNAAAPVAEGALKPDSNYGWENETFNVRTIAHWVKISRQTLADVPRFQGTVDRLMREDLLIKLEDEIVDGDGTGSHLVGILQTPGTTGYTAAANESRVVSIRKALTAAVATHRKPTATVVNPFDAELIDLERDNSGATEGTGRFLVGDPRGGAINTLWRRPLVESFAIPQGTFLTGFLPEIDLATREGVTARVSDSDQDDFVKNLVTLLVEGRWGLPIARPGLLVVGEFADADPEDPEDPENP